MTSPRCRLNGFIWQAGGDIWDETSTKPALGVVNSDKAVTAFEHYLSLEKYMPPVAKTGQMDIFVVQDLYMQGKVAAIVDWVGVMGPVINPKLSKVADKTGFAEPPGTRRPDGSISRWSNIGGQPFVLTTWNSDEVIKEGLDIVKWWMSKPVQINFVKAGGQSGMLSVMDDPAYATWAPYNRAYLDNYRWQKDVWHIPEFFPLLTEQQEQIRQGDHRSGQRQGGSGYGRRVPGQAAARRRPHQVSASPEKRSRRSLLGAAAAPPSRPARAIPDARSAPSGPAVSDIHDFSRKSGYVNERCRRADPRLAAPRVSSAG